MMKTPAILIVFATFILSGTVYSQTKVPQYYELKGQAYDQADSLLKVWMKNEYPAILKKNKLKMTCAHCTNIYMDVIVMIEPDGTFIDYQVVSSNKCGEAFSDDLKAEF